MRVGYTKHHTTFTKRKRHTHQEIIKKLSEAATLLASANSVEELCRRALARTNHQEVRQFVQGLTHQGFAPTKAYPLRYGAGGSPQSLCPTLPRPQRQPIRFLELLKAHISTYGSIELERLWKPPSPASTPKVSMAYSPTPIKTTPYSIYSQTSTRKPHEKG